MQIITWVLIFIIFVLLELLTSTALVSIWFAAGSIGAGITALITDNIAVQMIVFLVLSVSFICGLRPIAKKYFNNKIPKTNIDAIVGKIGIVTNKIDNIQNKGTVLIDGMEWTARASDQLQIEKDSLVMVISIEGVKLIVKPYKKHV